MGKRGAWLSAVKKAFHRDSKEKKGKKNHKSERCLGKERSIDLDSSNAEKAVVVPPAHCPPEEVKLMEAENAQNRHAYSVALVTAMAAEAAVAAAHAAAEVVRLRAAALNLGKTKEEIAAIKIQTAFRGYLARRALRALRGLVRLKMLVGGKSIKRQATSSLRCMHTLARLQSEVRARRVRVSEENSAIQRQIQQKHEKELGKLRLSIGATWDDRVQTKEQIEANLHYRQEAAMRRERAMAYAYSHQQTWRNSNSANQTFMDPNNPRWGWSWLERWMAARPSSENANAADKEPTNNVVPAKITTSHSISAKIHSPTSQKYSRQSPSTPKSRATAPRGTVGTDDDSKSMISTQSERYPKHSIAGSSMRDDDESLVSSPAMPSYMVSTESARAKSRLASPLGSEKSSVGSAKKRLSFSSSSAGTRRHSVLPMMMDGSSGNGIRGSS